MVYRKNKASEETIGGEKVIRFNGNSCTRSRAAWSEGIEAKRAAYGVAKGLKARARKATREAEYRRRYLSG